MSKTPDPTVPSFDIESAEVIGKMYMYLNEGMRWAHDLILATLDALEGAGVKRPNGGGDPVEALAQGQTPLDVALSTLHLLRMGLHDSVTESEAAIEQRSTARLLGY